MKIVIISDIHANLAALEALPEDHYDELWCLGDLVDYGPNPQEVIRWIKKNANVVVRGNHDYAAGLFTNPRCSLPYRKLAAETLQYTLEECTARDLDYLTTLPNYRKISTAGTEFYLVHAIPSDPLFGYCPENSPKWREEVNGIQAEMLVVGHTHTPFVRKEGHTTILNPGSVGQPKTGRPQACYAIWEDGRTFLKEYDYPIDETIRGIRNMPIPTESQEALIAVLQTGEIPGRPQIND